MCSDSARSKECVPSVINVRERSDVDIFPRAAAVTGVSVWAADNNDDEMRRNWPESEFFRQPPDHSFLMYATRSVDGCAHRDAALNRLHV
jgi:hypothetical protein